MWDILTGQEKRSFFPEGSNVWPIFRWSNNDKYVAYMGEDVLSVYETPVSESQHFFENLQNRLQNLIYYFSNFIFSVVWSA